MGILPMCATVCPRPVLPGRGECSMALGVSGTEHLIWVDGIVECTYSIAHGEIGEGRGSGDAAPRDATWQSSRGGVLRRGGPATVHVAVARCARPVRPGGLGVVSDDQPRSLGRGAALVRVVRKASSPRFRSGWAGCCCRASEAQSRRGTGARVKCSVPVIRPRNSDICALP